MSRNIISLQWREERSGRRPKNGPVSTGGAFKKNITFFGLNASGFGAEPHPES